MVNGEGPCLRIRQAAYLPIIVLGGQEEAAEMFEHGADAYMTKPLSLKELVARVGALLRRKPRYGQPGDASGLETGDGRDNEGDDANGLTPTEFRLASCLVINRGQLLDYPRLIGEVWGGKGVSLDILHFYIRQLRHKLQHYFSLPYRQSPRRGLPHRIEAGYAMEMTRVEIGSAYRK